jgi:inosine-uridine nucleoside N-ribohydrolase
MSKKHARDETSPLIKRKLWIDTDCMVDREDGNLINGRADQDDGFALVAMLHLPALFDVVGVSSVFGNGPGASTYASLTKLIVKHDTIDVKGEPPNETGSLPIPQRKVFLGASEFLQTRTNVSAFEHDLIHEKVQTDASIAIVRQLEGIYAANQKHGAVEEKLTILAVGPVTNIASAILLIQATHADNPTMAHNLINVIEKVVVCGGYRKEGQLSRIGSKQSGMPVPGVKKPPDFPDMNFDFDVLAVQTLLQTAGLHVVMAGYEASTSFWLTQERLAELVKHGDRAIKYVASTEAVNAWVNFWKHNFGNWWDPELNGGKGGDSGQPIPGFHCFDLITAMTMVVPELLPSWEGPTYVKVLPLVPTEQLAPSSRTGPDATLANPSTVRVPMPPVATSPHNALSFSHAWHHTSFQVTKMFVICPNPAEKDQHHGGMLASAKVTYVKGLEPSLPAGCGVEPTDTQLRRECLAEIIMKVLEKPLSVEETHAILDKARGFGGESKAPAGKKPRRGKQA